jgi:hypothetical protein
MAVPQEVEAALRDLRGKLAEADWLEAKGRSGEGAALLRGARHDAARIFDTNDVGTDPEVVAALAEVDGRIEGLWKQKEGSGPAGAERSDEGGASGSGCGTVIFVLIVGAILYFGFGVGKDGGGDGGKKDAAVVDPKTVTCAELGLDNPSAPGGEKLKDQPEKVAALARELQSQAFSTGSEESRVKAMIGAIATVCVTAKSPDVRPVPDALEFARGIDSLSGGNGDSPEEAGTAEVERAFEEEIGRQVAEFSSHGCTRFSDTRYVCHGSGSSGGSRFDGLWDAEVAPDGTIFFTPKR